MSTGQWVGMTLGFVAGVALSITTEGAAIPAVLSLMATLTGDAAIGAGTEIVAEVADRQQINWSLVGITAGLSAATTLSGYGLGIARKLNGFHSRPFRGLMMEEISHAGNHFSAVRLGRSARGIAYAALSRLPGERPRISIYASTELQPVTAGGAHAELRMLMPNPVTPGNNNVSPEYLADVIRNLSIYRDNPEADILLAGSFTGTDFNGRNFARAFSAELNTRMVTGIDERVCIYTPPHVHDFLEQQLTAIVNSMQRGASINVQIHSSFDTRSQLLNVQPQHLRQFFNGEPAR